MRPENPDLWASHLAKERAQIAEINLQLIAQDIRNQLAMRYAERGNVVAIRLLTRPRGYFPTYLERMPQDRVYGESVWLSR